MAGRKINYHPDSIDSEGRSFVLIGLTIVSGLAAILFIFFLLDMGTPGTLEYFYMGSVACVPLAFAILAFKGDKESFAYDRYSQVVNYSEPADLILKELNPIIEKVSISTDDGATKIVDEQRYEITLEGKDRNYRCILKRRVYLPELTKENEGTTISAYIDLTTDEIAAFKLSENIYWAIPVTVLRLAEKKKG